MTKRTRKSRAAGAAMNVATVVGGAAVGHVAVKVAPKVAHLVAEEAVHFGLDKTFERGLDAVVAALGKEGE